MILRSVFISWLLGLAIFAEAQVILPAMRGVQSGASIPTTMYSGGAGSGDQSKIGTQNTCPPTVVQDIFYGGEGDGNQEQIVISNICTPAVIQDIYYGGEGDGNQEQTIIQNACNPVEIQDIFYGGLGYGSQQQSLMLSECSLTAIEDIFYGGDGPVGSENVTIQCYSSLIRFYDPGNSSSYDGSSTSLYDLTVNTVTGTLVNGVSYNSSNGGTLVFDGTNDYVSFASGFPTTDQLTYESWVYPSALGDFRVILNHDGWSLGDIHFQFRENQLQFALNGESDQYSTYSFETNKWYHVAAVYSKAAKTVSFYVNGALTNIENYSNPPSISSKNLKMGAWNGNERFFKGEIGLLKIYNAALSSAEIASNFNATKSSFGL